MRLADYVIRFLADRGVRHVFVVTGGGAMHLNDALGREPRITYVCNHHEQASAMAAEGYSRTNGTPGVVSVTSGPGGVNALNGVFGAFTDSIAMIVISGQMKRQTLLETHGLLGRLRQLGDQEVDIVGMVKRITKSAVLLTDPERVRYELERAWHCCQSGRPGPCWIDIPVDVQAADIDPAILEGYTPSVEIGRANANELCGIAEVVLAKIKAARRPVILAGTGVRISGATDLFRRVVSKLMIPVATAWTHDVIETESPCACGKAGSIGDRPGNFAVQNSDLVLVIGSRLNIRQVSYNWENFARNAEKIVVDIDPEELAKPMVRPDLAICADARDFLEAIDSGIDTQGFDSEQHLGWLAWCRERVKKYPVFNPLKHVSRPGAINPYHFFHEFFTFLKHDDVIVCGDATACIVTFQSSVIRRQTRLFSNSGSASMGYDLPAAIGAAVARGGKRVICLAGDGSLQMNIQELQTVRHHRFPIKLFVLNNGGYLSIRQTQRAFFGFAVGAGIESGISCPDFVRVAEAYGLPASRLDSPTFGPDLSKLLDASGPHVCEVVLDPTQGIEPKLSSRQMPDGKMVSSPLDDMAPFLDRSELAENTHPEAIKMKPFPFH
jgi:acetolactate synthase-1/2/3 large subunit